MNPKVRPEDPSRGIHYVRTFIGLCSFYRRYMKNFTYTSAILKDLIKKSTTLRSRPQHQQAFDEHTYQGANAKCFGARKAQGKIILVTDASNLGRGGTLFQWQALEKGECNSGTEPRLNPEAQLP